MQKLDPKSKWLFFTQYVSAALGITLAFSFTAMSVTSTTGMIGAGMGISFGFFILTIAIAYLAAYLSYINYSYQLEEHVFKKEFGVIMRRSTNIPYERIQNVDIVRGLLSRMLGLADLNIQTAGGNSYGLKSEGRLPGVSKQDAVRIQAELLARARGATHAPVMQPQAPAMYPTQTPIGNTPQPPINSTPQDRGGL